MPALSLQQLPEVLIAKAGEPILVLDNERPNRQVRQELGERGAMVVEPRGHFADRFGDDVALGGGVVPQTLPLPIEARLLVGRGDPRVPGHPPWWRRGQ